MNYVKSIIFKKTTAKIDIDGFLNSFEKKIKFPVTIINFDFNKIQPRIGIYYKIYYKFE